jgi:Ca-activated chloride channel family protein
VLSIRRWTLLLLALTPLARSPLAAQEPLTIRCRPVQCVSAPCPPPPCAREGRVERTGREVRVSLDGRVLRYEVTERWTNHGHTIGEADYVLPLPRGAAFEDLALEIDGEMVTGEALGAGEARRIYEEIVRRQRDPALVEWMGMGVLRTRIFPIQPGETRTVVVRFRAVAERDGDALRVDIPAPRGNGTAASGTALTFRWPSGEGFGEAWSPTHAANVTREQGQRVARVTDAVGTVTLLLPVRAGRDAAMTVLTHAPRAGEGYVLLTLAPPARVAAQTPRDVTFVVDVSGSMSGGKLAQAKAAGVQFLNSLAAGDRFRLIAFSGDVSDFREGWTEVNASTRRDGAAWLEGLAASGGTNIGGALERALEARTPAQRLGLILFLTDGAPTVGERRPDRLAARAAELRGERRVFTFGLGADVNAALLEQLALDGAGTAHFVRPEEDVERVVGVVAQRITRPVATDLRVRADGVTLQQVMPAGRIDLFAGQELTILARYVGAAPRGRITITGRTPDGPVSWETQASFPQQRTQDAFVGRLWATQRVGWLSAERRRNGASTELDSEMRELGTRWGIPTELTSYLVLEPGMTIPQATSGPIGRTGRMQPMRGDASGAGAAAPPPAPSAFEAARQAADMRSSRSVAESEQKLDGRRERRTADRMFVLQDSMWTDTRAAASQARVVRVRPYSAAYFALMERHAELREILALGEQVQVHGRAVTLVLAADGVERLDAQALAAFTRDW